MPALRKIIKIDETKCTGCGLCMPNCPEGAIQIIDKKARLVSDLFCDGLGACIGHCPEGAISIEERESQPYDERLVMDNIIKNGPNVIKAHLKHLKEHRQEDYLKEALAVLGEKGIAVPDLSDEGPAQSCAHSGCPGSRIVDMTRDKIISTAKGSKTPSQLRQWPVQLMLVPPMAPYLKDADILIAADCVPFAYPDFHTDILKGKVLLVGCPKLDNNMIYVEKLRSIFQTNNVRSVTYAHMEVPCCYGLIGIIKDAIRDSGRDIPFKDITVTIKGEASGVQ